MDFTQWFKSKYELYSNELDEKPALLVALLMVFFTLLWILLQLHTTGFICTQMTEWVKKLSPFDFDQVTKPRVRMGSLTFLTNLNVKFSKLTSLRSTFQN